MVSSAKRLPAAGDETMQISQTSLTMPTIVEKWLSASFPNTS
jgi:hypothetical protein